MTEVGIPRFFIRIIQLLHIANVSEFPYYNVTLNKRGNLFHFLPQVVHLLTTHSMHSAFIILSYVSKLFGEIYYIKKRRRDNYE